MCASSRRSFLKTASLVAAALPFAGVPLAAASRRPRSGRGAQPGGRPGLFFDRGELPRIRETIEHPRFEAVRVELFDTDFEAETRFLREELRLTNHVADFARARILVERASFAFALRGDERHLELARLAISRILDYKRWDYFLEAGETTLGLQRAPEGTIALLCALDWIGEYLVPGMREEMERQIAAKGAAACYATLYGMKYPDRVRGWGFDPEDDYAYRFDLSRWPLILNATNLKVIPTCALGMAGAWLSGRHPEAGKWVEMSRQSARAFSIMYGLDGSYDEGAGYWGYTTMHMVMLADVLYRLLGVDERNLINYPGTIRYALAMTMPTLGEPYTNPNEPKQYNATPKGVIDPASDLVNFGDSGISIDMSVAGWVAHAQEDPVAQYAALHVGKLRHLQAAIWLRPDAKAMEPGPDLHDVRMSNDWVISRTGFRARDSVVAFRSGGPANHEHADRNSVIFKAYGERLFHDPYKAAYSNSSPRWLLRLGPAHTAVLIDGQGHQYHDGSEGTNASWASARITHFAADGERMIAVSDATEAYRLVLPETEFVERIVVFQKPDVLVLIDRVRCGGKPRPVQARFQVMNEDGKGSAKVEAGGFRIDRPNASLHATAKGSGRLEFLVDRHPLPVEEGEYPFVEVTSPAAREHLLVTACTAAPNDGSHGSLAIGLFDMRVEVTGTHLGRMIDLRVQLRKDNAELLA